MTESNKEKVILLVLHNGSKVEGILIKIDKENLKMILERGKIIKENCSDEAFDKIEISKKDIKEIRVLEEKEIKKEQPKLKPQETEKVQIAKPQVVTTSSVNNDSTFNSIPLSIQQQYAHDSSKYEKGDFFDGLTISNNRDNYKDIRTYNEKNKETFNLDDNYVHHSSYRKRRGGHGGGNNGGHHQGGGYHQNGRGNGYRGRGGYNQTSRGGRGSNRGGNYNNNYNSQGGYLQSNHYGVKNENSSTYPNEVSYGYNN